MLRDNDLAVQALAQYDPREDVAPEASFIGLTREVEMLIHAVNTMQTLVTVVVSALGGGGGRPSLIPLPRSRFDELLDIREAHEVDDLAQRFGLD